MKAENTYRGLLVVIPTRNRSQLAIRAISNTLGERVQGTSIIVSDNSTEEAERASLENYCQSLKSDRLFYIKPPSPLPMAEHWNWLFGQVLGNWQENHVAILGDRRLFRRGCLAEICAAAESNPASIVMYKEDAVYDDTSPVGLERKLWTGQILRCEAGQILLANSRMKSWECVPSPQYSILPRRVFAEVMEKYGNYCLSIAPDFCLGIRALTLERSVLLYDKAVILHSALHRSNGHSMSHGVLNKDSKDFVGQFGHKFAYYCTPIPEIATSCNAVVHEYEFVKNQSPFAQFPSIDVRAYIAFLRDEVQGMRDQEKKAFYVSLIDRFAAENNIQLEAHFAAPKNRLRSAKRGVVGHLKNAVAGQHTRGFWWFLYSRMGVPPPQWINFSFASSEAAVDYAMRFPGPRVQGLEYLYHRTGLGHGAIHPVNSGEPGSSPEVVSCSELNLSLLK